MSIFKITEIPKTNKQTNKEIHKQCTSFGENKTNQTQRQYTIRNNPNQNRS